MNAPIHISMRVIKTINSLPTEDRLAVSAALADDMIYTNEIPSYLTPLQGLAFTIIRSYVQRDSRRMAL